jgi:hypothetical protein
MAEAVARQKGAMTTSLKAGAELPIPTTVDAVAWAEEADMIAGVLRELSDKFNGVDNGHCRICRGFRFCNTRSHVQPCETADCLSHRISAILERYEPPSKKVLAQIKRNCLAALAAVEEK